MSDATALGRMAGELEALRARLDEAEQTLAAIRSGAADAIVVCDPRGDRVYTLSGADRIYRDIVENLSEGTATLSADGIVLHCNAALAAMLGLPAEDVAGTRIRAHLAAPLGATDFLLADGTGARQEAGLITAGGGRVPVLLAAVAVRGEGLEPLTCLIAIDLTERKRAEALLQQMNESLQVGVARRTAELQAANEELEAFTYSVSHDLRAPLRVIDGYARVLLEDHVRELDDDARRVVGVVVSEVRRMDRLIADLLQLSRAARYALELETVDMTELAGAVVQETLAAHQGAAHITLRPLPPARGAPRLLRQVWANLVSNAVKFTGRRADPAIEIGGRPETGGVTYYVRDNGVGFDMRFADKLFDVFQRLHSDSEFEGSGVGLAIVRRIVSRHGGRAWAEGAPGAGATFFFRLPSDPRELDTAMTGAP